jgi:predicted polyphosphate/ATP-dependent NAD kinase
MNSWKLSWIKAVTDIVVPLGLNRRLQTLKADNSTEPTGSKNEVGYPALAVQNLRVWQASSKESIDEISNYILGEMREDLLYILPPGQIESTVKGKLGSTNPGVDVIQAGSIITADADERMLLDIARKHKGKVIKSIAPEDARLFKGSDKGVYPHLLKEIGKENILLYTTPESLASLNGSPLIVDTGDPELDAALCGFYSVSTSHGKRAIYKAISSAENTETPED